MAKVPTCHAWCSNGDKEQALVMERIPQAKEWMYLKSEEGLDKFGKQLDFAKIGQQIVHKLFDMAEKGITNDDQRSNNMLVTLKGSNVYFIDMGNANTQDTFKKTLETEFVDTYRQTSSAVYGAFELNCHISNKFCMEKQVSLVTGAYNFLNSKNNVRWRFYRYKFQKGQCPKIVGWCKMCQSYAHSKRPEWDYKYIDQTNCGKFKEKPCEAEYMVYRENFGIGSQSALNNPQIRGMIDDIDSDLNRDTGENYEVTIKGTKLDPQLTVGEC